jgi:hypothetical protein
MGSALTLGREAIPSGHLSCTAGQGEILRASCEEVGNTCLPAHCEEYETRCNVLLHPLENGIPNAQVYVKLIES